MAIYQKCFGVYIFVWKVQNFDNSSSCEMHLLKLPITLKCKMKIYINSVSLLVCPYVKVLKPRSLLIKLSPPTWRLKNYSKPRVLTSYFYVCFRAAIVGDPYFLLLRHFCAAIVGGPYFLFLLLCSFPCNNWGKYFWDLEGGWRDLGALFWAKSLRGSRFLFFSWKGKEGEILGVLIGEVEP